MYTPTCPQLTKTTRHWRAKNGTRKADVAECWADIFRHVSDLSSDMSMSHLNCRRRHPTNPTKNYFIDVLQSWTYGCKISCHVPCSCSLESHFDLINWSCNTSLSPSHKHSLSYLIPAVTYVLSSLSILLTVPWQFRGSGSLLKSKWCHYDMIEPDNHLNHCFPHP